MLSIASTVVESPACRAVSSRYWIVPPSSGSSIAPARCSVSDPWPISFQPSISRSCSELYWSASFGIVLLAIASSSHTHWNTPVSYSEVGVSALYSSSFAGPLPVVGQIEAAVEARIVALPACRDEGPEPFRDAQQLEHALVVDRARDQFAAHLVELGGRRLDVALDLLQREGVVGALVPVALARDGVEAEAVLVGPLAPVRPLVAGDVACMRVEFSRPRRGGKRFSRSIQSRSVRCRSPTPSLRPGATCWSARPAAAALRSQTRCCCPNGRDRSNT